MRKLAALLLVLCLCLTGCVSRQLEEQLLVISLGLDKTEAGHIRISVKVPSNSGGGGGESGGGESASSGGEQAGYLLLEAEGASFSDAMNLLHATTPRTLNFSQIREVTVGERAAADVGFADLLEAVLSLPRIREDAALVSCKGDAKAFIEAQKPYVGARLSRYIETTLLNYAGKGFVPNTSLGQAVRDLGYGFQDPLLIYGAVNDFAGEPGPAENALDAVAGELARKSVNKVELFGAAATDGVCVSGVLTGYEMALLHLVRGDVQSLNVQMGDDLAIPIFAVCPAGLGVDRQESPARLTVRLACEAHALPDAPPDADALCRMLEQEITSAIRRLQAFRCDGLGFGNAAVRMCRTVAEWEALSWRDVYAAADVDVDVTLHIRKN